MNATILQRFTGSLTRRFRFAPTATRFFATVALLATSTVVHAQLDGTLFTQPEERAYLDYLRDEFLRNNADQGFDIQEAEIPDVPTGEAAAPAGPIEFTFGGIMTRRDGSRSLWLNGALLAESALPAGMSLVSNERSTSLRIAHEGKVYVLQPGQTVDLVAGSVMENYQRPQALPSDKADSTPVEAAASPQEPAEGAATDDTSAISAEPRTSAPATDITGNAASTASDAVAAALRELDDSALAALADVIESRRQEIAEDTDDEGSE